MRLGLCCAFRDEPIRFANTTVTAIRKAARPAALEKIAGICQANAEALRRALEFCAANGIGCFRIVSQILPLKTHVELGYACEELPGGEAIVAAYHACGELARRRGLRTCFHPDQFVVLNSRRPEVVEASLRELEYQAEVAEWVGADVINVHGGGAFGDKRRALDDFRRALDRLSDRARRRLTVENDDKIFSPADLLPTCRAAGVPLVYDVHHHRCLPDELDVEAATREALATWNREPLFHVSSPLEGWDGPGPQRHHDFLDPRDFPDAWRSLDVTVEVEAKAKEVAVLRLRDALEHGPARPAKRTRASRG